jgi:hypothetical protein
MFNNSGNAGLREIAAGEQTSMTQISDAAIWQHLIQEYGHDAG